MLETIVAIILIAIFWRLFLALAGIALFLVGILAVSGLVAYNAGAGWGMLAAVALVAASIWTVEHMET